MSRPHLWLCLLATLVATSVAPAAEGWAQLKNGMKLEEVSRLLGKPVLTSQSRGYDLWIYDYGAETIAVNGALIGWTEPKPPAATARPAAAALVQPAAKSVAVEAKPESSTADVQADPVLQAAEPTRT